MDKVYKHIIWLYCPVTFLGKLLILVQQCPQTEVDLGALKITGTPKCDPIRGNPLEAGGTGLWTNVSYTIADKYVLSGTRPIISFSDSFNQYS